MSFSRQYIGSVSVLSIVPGLGWTLNIFSSPEGRGATTDSGPPGQHIHSGPPAFRGGGGGGYGWGYRGISPSVEIAIAFPSPSFSPSPKSDYTVSVRVLSLRSSLFVVL